MRISDWSSDVCSSDLQDLQRCSSGADRHDRAASGIRYCKAALMPVVHVGRELHSEGIDLRDAGADHSGAGKQSAQCSSTGSRHGAAIEGQGQSPIAVLCDCEAAGDLILNDIDARSEAQTSELQSLM